MADYTAGSGTGSSPTRFLDRQINTYGYPRRTAVQPGAATQPAQPAIMPNGQPMVAQPQPQPTATQPAAPAPAPAQPVQAAPASQQPVNAGAVNAAGVYTAGQAPTQLYNPQQVSQFQQPNFGGIQGQQQGMIGALLANPYSLSPQVISQMKGANTDQAALLNRQTMGQLQSRLASRGISGQEGYGLGLQRELDMGTNRDILNSNRGIDIQAAGQNRQDLLGALGMADQFQNNTLQRAIGGYGAELSGLEANRAEQNNWLNSIYQQFGAQKGMLDTQAQTQQGAIGQGLQGQQIANQASQFDTSQRNQQSNFADQLAFQYQQAQNGELDTLLKYLMSGGSGQ